MTQGLIQGFSSGKRLTLKFIEFEAKLLEVVSNQGTGFPHEGLSRLKGSP